MTQTVLVFIAHPDDEFHCLGTIIQLARAGARVVLVPATNGDKGVNDGSISPDALIPVRWREMEQVRALIGAAEVVWLGFEDGTLDLNRAALAAAVARTVAQYRPQIVFTHDPWRRWELHSDHRAIGFAAAAAVAGSAAGYGHGATGGPAAAPVRLYFFHSEQPNHRVPIDAVLGLKLQAAQAHISQRRPGTVFDTRVEKAKAGEGIEGHELLVEAFHSPAELGPLGPAGAVGPASSP